MGPILFGQCDIGARCCFHWRSAFCSPSISCLINILSSMSSLSSRRAWSSRYKSGCLSLRFGNRKVEDQIQKFKVGCVLGFVIMLNRHSIVMFSEIDKLSFRSIHRCYDLVQWCRYLISNDYTREHVISQSVLLAASN